MKHSQATAFIRSVLLFILLLFRLELYASERDSVFSRGKNQIELHACYHTFPSLYSSYPFMEAIANFYIGDQLGVYYQRKFKSNFFVGAGYETWNTYRFLIDNIYGDEIEVKGNPVDSKPGTLQWRTQYKMADIYAGYCYEITSKNNIQVAAGYSKTWGTDTYTDSVWVYGWHATVTTHDQPGKYNGIMAFAKYNHYILKGRMSLGLDIKWRNYSGLYGYEIDYGYNLSVYF